MASIVPGFEYDVFISYRHKDNKYDGWVTEFVSNLRKEIAATFKEELTIYFDENPHDGLLETQHVDKSLERKLKCLIFIPILSQTYCDTNSFAWKNEFCVFNRLADKDMFGRYIRLANGNVNSRILPIRIHELEQQDQELLETELAGKLRAIDFIYRTPGVNRPLRAVEDEPKENLNHTFYRDQINKVANTIKSTVAGIRMMNPGEDKIPVEEINNPEIPPKPFVTKRLLAYSFIFLGMLTAGVWAMLGFPNPMKGSSPVDRSIAVLPFADLSPNKDQEYFSDGLSEELLNLLSRIPDLKVISRTSAFSFKGKNEDASSIGKALGVAQILEGSVRKSDNKIRISTKLIQVSDGSQVWSQTYDRTLDDIFKIQDDIANAVVLQLKMTLAENNKTLETFANTEAYNLYLQGKYFFTKRSQDNVSQAIDLYTQAIQLDSVQATYWAALSLAYASQADNGAGNVIKEYQKARQAAEKAIALDPTLANGHYALASIKTTHDWDWAGAEADFKKAYSLNPANVGTLNGMANLARTMSRLDDAMSLYKSALELDPLRIAIKVNLGRALMHSNQLDEAASYFRSALEMNNEFPTVHYNLGLTYLLQGKSDEAIQELNKEPVEDWRIQGLAMAHFDRKDNDLADSLLRNLIKDYGDVSAFQIAEVYGYRNEPDRAFEWIEKAIALRDGGVTNVVQNVWLDKIKSDNRYSVILKKLSLSRLTSPLPQ